MLKEKLLNLLFPPKCVLCSRVLSDEQTDLCHNCRQDTDEFTKSKKKFSFVAGWTSLWYYTGNVRHSMLLYKFYRRRSYGPIYGRLLAMKLHAKPLCSYDVLTWVPVSKFRLMQRGYDQVELIACSLGQELGTPAIPVLTKQRHTKPQSRLNTPERRRANILGAFRVNDIKSIQGKTVLLIDDIITTGSTISECARVLLTAGAKAVYCAAVAVPHDKKEKRR